VVTYGEGFTVLDVLVVSPAGAQVSGKIFPAIKTQNYKISIGRQRLADGAALKIYFLIH
jgi:hypothetical protein